VETQPRGLTEGFLVTERLANEKVLINVTLPKGVDKTAKEGRKARERGKRRNLERRWFEREIGNSFGVKRNGDYEAKSHSGEVTVQHQVWGNS